MGHRRRPATMYIKERDAACDYTVYRTNDGSLKSECVCGGMRANGWFELVGLRVFCTCLKMWALSSAAVLACCGVAAADTARPRPRPAGR